MIYHHKFFNMPSGAVFYSPLSSTSATAETGQTLAYTRTFNATVKDGIPCLTNTSANSYIVVDLSSASSSWTQVSVSVWINYNNATFPGNSDYLFAFGKTGTDKRIAAYQSPSGMLNYNYGGSSAAQTISFPHYGWHHIVYTYNSSNNECKAYFDGLLCITDTRTLDILGGNLYLLTRPDTSYSAPANVLIAAARVYDRALTQAEVTALSKEFSNTSSGFNAWGKPVKYRSAFNASCGIVKTEWDKLSRQIQGGSFTSARLGEIITVPHTALSSPSFPAGSINFQVVAIDNGDLVESYQHSITLMAQDVLFSSKFNGYGNEYTNVGAWYNPNDSTSSILRTLLQGDFYKCLDPDFATHIALVNRPLYVYNGGSGGSQIVQDTVFVPSYTELGFGDNHGVTEGVQFDFMTDGNARKKSDWYWTSSMAGGENNRVYGINSSDGSVTLGGDYCWNSHKVVPVLVFV